MTTNEFILATLCSMLLGATLAISVVALVLVCWKRRLGCSGSGLGSDAATDGKMASVLAQPLIAPQHGAEEWVPATVDRAAFRALRRWIGNRAARQLVACEVEQRKLRSGWTSSTKARMVAVGDVSFGAASAALLVDHRPDALIHRGTFSSLHLGVLRRSGGSYEDEYVAVKMVVVAATAPATMTAMAAAEAGQLASMPPHANVIRRRLFEAPRAPLERDWRSGLQVVELCAHSLSQHDLERSPEFRKLIEIDAGVSLHIAQGVLNGLQHLHRHGMHHGNIKPASVLVSFFAWRTEEFPYGFDIKLGNFGSDAAEKGSNVYTTVGGVITGWRAPECYTLANGQLQHLGAEGGGGSAAADAVAIFRDAAVGSSMAIAAANAATMSLPERQCADAFSVGLLLFHLFFRTRRVMYSAPNEAVYRQLMVDMFAGKVDTFHREQMQQLIDSTLRFEVEHIAPGGQDGGMSDTFLLKLQENIVSLKLALVAGLTVRAPAARLSVEHANRLVNNLDFGHKHGTVPQTSAHVKTIFLCSSPPSNPLAGARANAYMFASHYPLGSCIVRRSCTPLILHKLLHGHSSCEILHIACHISEGVDRLHMHFHIGGASTQSVPGTQFVHIIKQSMSTRENPLHTIVLMCCHARTLADRLKRVGVPCVIGWEGRLLDERDVTSEFGNTLHRAIAQGQSPRHAFEAAKQAILDVTEFRGTFDEQGRCVFEPKFALLDPEADIVDQDKGRVITLARGGNDGEDIFVLGPLAVGIPFFLSDDDDEKEEEDGGGGGGGGGSGFTAESSADMYSPGGG